MHSRGEYVKKSERKAYLWYRYGALHGDCNSQYDYSICLRYGEGCNASEDDAEKWLLSAARNGSEEALECLNRQR
ncbi:MAG: sel1 repeat family protein [Kiritimatiellae bacterium]|nr:sel1 repeat family protein [Kiritimatiellia bacterium]